MRRFNSRRRPIAVFLLITFLFQICLPIRTFALTGGPSQPEVQSFEPVGTTDMVDLFTGDFNYNIPLLDVEGYPINISYHSGVSMDQEASWVGLGWNINPGVINRNMRGLPDDFNGDNIRQLYKSKPHETWGVLAGLGMEFFGKEIKDSSITVVAEKLKNSIFGSSSSTNKSHEVKTNTSKKASFPTSINFGIKNDNYRGRGVSFGISPSVAISKLTTTNSADIESSIPLVNKVSNQKLDKIDSRTQKFGLDLNFDSQNGFSSNGSYTYKKAEGDALSAGGAPTHSFSVGSGYNSRSGFTSLTAGWYTGTSRMITDGKMYSPLIETGSSNGATFLTQNHPSYQPSAVQPINTFAIAGNFKAGGELWGINGEIDLNGYYTNQHYKDEDVNRKAYGSLYDYNAGKNDFVKDFNRYNLSSFSATTQDLPLSTLTYDYFSVSGQGVAGAYRAKQSYIPIVYDDEVRSFSTDVSVGGEIGAGNLTKWGLNAGIVFTSKRDGVKGINDKEEKFISLANALNRPFDFEYTYFKYLGERTPIDQEQYRAICAKSAIDPSMFIDSIKNANDYHYISHLFKSKEGINKPIRNEREKRNQVFQFLTVGQIANVPELALDSKIKSYPLNSLTYPFTGVQEISRFDGSMDHISEVSVLSDDGRRYVYGIPAMNTKQIEYTFSVSKDDAVSNGIVTYPTTSSGTYPYADINYHSDDKFINYSYHEQEMPRYAHSYLLTGVLSDDYVDIKQDGITDDDYGSAVKFNYTRITDHYHWRTPYKLKSANYQPGYKSNNNDNTANFIYGEKEVWYMNSIESKNMIAIITLSRREDGLGVKNMHGDTSLSDTLMKIDKITLYSKADLRLHGSSAVPIKTVYFEYDYTSCPNVENNSQRTVTFNGVNINASKGKLTLRKIYFTYGNSNKGKYTSYYFSYSSTNPDYNIKAYDRWGNYSPYSAGGSSSCDNSEYPFVSQDKSQADGYASAWNLNKIELPTGGVINITYESDDYAYVQDKKAMQMFMIKGFGENSASYNPASPNNKLYEDNDTNNNYVFIEIPGLTTKKLNECLDGLDKIYYNLNSQIREYKDKYNTLQKPKDDIFGFCDLELDENNKPLCGIVSGNIAWIKVQKVGIKDGDKGNLKIQPMAKNAFIFSVQNLPEQVFPGSMPNATGEKEWKGLLTSMQEFTSLYKTFYRKMRDKKYCQQVVLGKSYIRLNTPGRFKMGGGCRVKKLELDDKWKDMENTSTNVTSSKYGQEYDYKTVDSLTSDTISSGVAIWEPTIGGEENPFRIPKYEVHKRIGSRDEVITHLEPVAEAFYPSPNVGYSKVTVKSLGGTTGRTVTEFYTAKDFPTRVYRTSLERSTSDNPYFKGGSQLAQKGINIGMNAIKLKKLKLGLDLNLDYLVARQGYTIVNNDMHGKIHFQTIYPEGTNNEKSKVEYVYQTIKEFDESTNQYETHLDNTVLTYDYADNSVTPKQVAMDYDMTYDKQAEETITASGKFQMNNDMTVVPPNPVPVPALTFFLGFGFALNDFKYTAITKVVNQYGILKTVKAYEDGSNIETNNLMYDAHTGEVLLTETQNEFNDKLYNLSYPAHFAYDGMGQAYRNLNIVLPYIKSDEKGAMSLALDGSDNISKSLVVGDEVLLEGIGVDNTIIHKKAWVHKLKSSSDFCLLDKNGAIFTRLQNVTITVIRSGRRNMQNIPIGGLVTLKNPLVYSGGVYSLVIDNSNVLNASAQTFSDQWQTLCENEKKAPCTAETDIGKAFKRWIYRLVKKNKLKDDLTYSTDIDTLVTQQFKDILFCGGSPATNYYTTHDDCSPVVYYFRSATDTCCSFSLSSFYNKGVTHQLTRYLVMLLANDSTFQTNNGTLVNVNAGESDTLTHKIRFSHQGKTGTTGSWTYFNVFDNDSTVDTSHYHLFQVSHSFYDSIPLTYGSQPNILYKYTIQEDTTEYTCISYHDTNSAGTNIVSVDTNSFQTNNTSIDSSAGKKFKILATLANGDKVWLSGSFSESCSLVLFEKCCTDCLPPDNKVINPYTENVRGAWRKKADYAYMDKRVQSESGGAHSPKLRNDGTYSDFKAFWNFNTDKYTQTTNTQWKKASEVTVYNPYGNEMEDKNALGVYSSALFGYNFRLPIAVASNAKYTQIAYEGFEDYGMTYGGIDCPFNHWNFEWSIKRAYLDDNMAHSGTHSLRVLQNDSEMVSRRIFDCSNVYKGIETDKFAIDACDCIKKFSPDSGEYLIGAWIKEDHSTNQPLISNYSDACLKVKLRKTCSDADSLVYIFKPSGPVIEEWQRVEGRFKIPEGYSIVEVYLVAPNQRAWFDDIRIHPYRGNIKTFAYNQVSLKLMAEMDENNFATFYEYDLEGQLMRVKKETIKGIVTLKEVRSNSSNK